PIAELHLKNWNEVNKQMAVETNRTDIDDVGGAPKKSDKRGTDTYQWYHLLRARMTLREYWPLRVKIFAERWEAWKTDQGFVDFTDMVEFGATLPSAPGNPKVIILDEAQDTSKLEWHMLNRWAETAGALILAGDPYQELYAWRGSDASIFLDPSVPEDHRRLLHQSFRVPKKVRDASLAWLRRALPGYQEIDYRPREGDEGSVHLSRGMWKHDPKPVIQKVMERLEETEDQTIMISATCGYMLGPTIALLKKNGIPFSNPWRRKRGDWNPLWMFDRRDRSDDARMSTVEKIQLFIGVICDNRTIVYEDFSKVVALLKTSGVLRHGVKTYFKQMAREEPMQKVPLDILQGAFEEEPGKYLKYLNQYDVDREIKFLEWLSKNSMKGKQKGVDYVLQIGKKFGLDAQDAA
ncbi:hypothetical protein LCGC14_2811000, partial [marine sediment metagenome]